MTAPLNQQSGCCPVRRGVEVRFLKQNDSLLRFFPTAAQVGPPHREKRLMFLNRPDDYARSSAPRLILGAGCGALLILSFAGASLALSQSGAKSWKPGFNELRLNRAPRPAIAPRDVA